VFTVLPAVKFAAAIVAVASLVCSFAEKVKPPALAVGSPIIIA
jgi:hypothetical protein